VNQVWHKTRVDPHRPWSQQPNFLGAVAAATLVHPVPGVSTENLTDQLGAPGLWMDRLPHFRLEAIPASGAEYQTEYMVARSVAVDAIRALRSIASILQPHLLISEIRTVAADDFWLSSAYGVDTVCLHFSWRQDIDAVNAVLPKLETALAPFGPRPHWGKLFLAPAGVLEPRYPKMADFRQLATRLDPAGKFRNAFLDRHIFD
jgi:xylitol oxidase